MKRRIAVFIARAGVRAGSERGLHFGSGSAPRRLEQSVRRIGGILQQPVGFGSPKVCAVFRIVEGKLAVIITRAGVRAAFDQRHNHDRVASGFFRPMPWRAGSFRRRMKRRIVVRVGVRAAFDQRHNHGRVGIVNRRNMKRRIAAFGERAGVRAGSKQSRNHSRILVALRRPMKRCCTVRVITCAHVSTGSQKSLTHSDALVVRSPPMKRCPTLLSACVYVRAGVDTGAHIVHSRGFKKPLPEPILAIDRCQCRSSRQHQNDHHRKLEHELHPSRFGYAAYSTAQVVAASKPHLPGQPSRATFDNTGVAASIKIASVSQTGK